MPITQERMMTVLELANDSMIKLDGIIEFAAKIRKDNLFVNLNSVIDKIDDEIAKTTVQQLQTMLYMFVEGLREIEPAPSARRLIAEEIAHFKAVKKRNELAAKYQVRRRLRDGATPQKPGRHATPEAVAYNAPRPNTPAPPLPQYLQDYLDGKITKEQMEALEAETERQKIAQYEGKKLYTDDGRELYNPPPPITSGTNLF